MDKAILKPVAKGYKAVTPAFLRRGIGNFFANLYDINGAVNALLQAQLARLLDRDGDPDPDAIADEILVSLRRLLCGDDRTDATAAA